MFLFSGLVRERSVQSHADPIAGSSNSSSSSFESTQNALWALDLQSNEWSLLYANPQHEAGYWARMADKEPCPRYAHQFTSIGDGTVYLFGGNPGDVGNPKSRLDDMWMLRVIDGDCAYSGSGDSSTNSALPGTNSPLPATNAASSKVEKMKRHLKYLLKRHH